MTLKEKFGELYIEKGMSFECEKIADEFAIEFAEFQSRFLTKPVEGSFYCYYNSQWITTKQLLEIYKKEKGL